MFHVSSKVFRCVCFVHNLGPCCDKLSAKLVNSIFLGYSGFRTTVNVTVLIFSGSFCLQMCPFLRTIFSLVVLYQLVCWRKLFLYLLLLRLHIVLLFQVHTHNKNCSISDDIVLSPLPECSTSNDNVKSNETDIPNVPIGLQKGKRTHKTPLKLTHPMSNFVLYDRVSPSY